MKKGDTYTARVKFTTIDQNDQEITIEPGLLLASAFDQLLNATTGEVYRLPLHIARNPDWYFHRMGDLFALAAPKVSQTEYARELVRANEGLDFDCLWQLGEKEGWIPCSTAPASRNVFSACLSNHPQVQVMLEGVPVKGTKRERGHFKGYTYHAKKAA